MVDNIVYDNTVYTVDTIALHTVKYYLYSFYKPLVVVQFFE